MVGRGDGLYVSSITSPKSATGPSPLPAGSTCSIRSRLSCSSSSIQRRSAAWSAAAAADGSIIWGVVDSPTRSAARDPLLLPPRNHRLGLRYFRVDETCGQ
jgi:hypothetical protein